MNIQLESASVSSFDPDPAIQEWFKGSKRSRRPGFMDGEPKTKTSRLERSLPEYTLDNRDDEDVASKTRVHLTLVLVLWIWTKTMCAMTVNLRWRMSSQRRMLFRDLI